MEKSQVRRDFLEEVTLPPGGWEGGWNKVMGGRSQEEEFWQR